MRTKRKLLLVLALAALMLSAWAAGDSSRSDDGSVENLDGMNVAIGSLFGEEIARNVTYRGGSIAENVLPNIDLNLLEASFFGAVTRYLSENPALGGLALL